MNSQLVKPRNVAIGLFAAIAATPLLLGNLAAIAKPMSSVAKPMSSVTNHQSPATHKSATSNQQVSRLPATYKQAVALKIGSQGKLVSQVQSYLKQQKLYKETVDGNYGAKTAKAVTAFQKSKNIKADGVAGSKTLAAMGV